MPSVEGKLSLIELPRIESRMSFLYVDRCRLSCHLNSLSIYSAEHKGTVSVPISCFLVLMIGPGVTVTSESITLLSEVGVTVLWVGEEGVRFYAIGRSLTESSRYLERQVSMWNNQRSRLQIAKSMFLYRFPDENVQDLNIRDLRLREASRVKSLYKSYADKYGIKFVRNYDVDDFAAGDPVNQALSSANVCLYGLCHAVIAALGMSCSLGFVHRGHALSFVYDMADLYKHEITVPLAFSIGTSVKSDYANIVRRECREIFRKTKLIKRIVNDIHALFGFESADVVVLSGVDLWGD